MQKNKTVPAIFFDRDGVLIEDTHLICNLEQAQVVPFAQEIVQKLSRLGHLLFVVTNQTVVARRMLSYQDTVKLNKSILDKVIGEDCSQYFKKIYICPHHPEATDEQYRVNCECRKPRPGMILKAAEEFSIDLKKSFLIGDRVSDIVAANLAGLNSILLKTKNIANDKLKMIKTNLNTEDVKLKKPDYTCDNLNEAFRIISNYGEVNGY